jgi:hypothetical protein
MSQTRERTPDDAEMSIESAILISARAHRGQTDLGGSPYILHPLRVMLPLAPPALMAPGPFKQIDFMVAAVLHDVVEDSDWTLERLFEARVSLVALEAIDHLTRRKVEGESYSAYIDRLSHNPIARMVKLQDIADNSLIWRLRPQHIVRYAGLFERDMRTARRLLGITNSAATEKQLDEVKLEQRATHRARQVAEEQGRRTTLEELARGMRAGLLF